MKPSCVLLAMIPAMAVAVPAPPVVPPPAALPVIPPPAERAPVFAHAAPQPPPVARDVMDDSAPAAASATDTAVPTSGVAATQAKPLPIYHCSTSFHYGNGKTKFQIAGRNFDERKLGGWGLGLLEKLRAFGEVKHWRFEWDDAFQNWKSTGYYKHNVEDWAVTGAINGAGGDFGGKCVREMQ